MTSKEIAIREMEKEIQQKERELNQLQEELKNWQNIKIFQIRIMIPR